MARAGLAQQAGFTISEISTLLVGFSEDTPPSERWRLLAQDKLPEVEVLLERALGMKDLLERGLRCECLRLETALWSAEKPQNRVKACPVLAGRWSWSPWIRSRRGLTGPLPPRRPAASRGRWDRRAGDH